MPNPRGTGRPCPCGEWGITGSPQESGWHTCLCQTRAAADPCHLRLGASAASQTHGIFLTDVGVPEGPREVTHGLRGIEREDWSGKFLQAGWRWMAQLPDSQQPLEQPGSGC